MRNILLVNLIVILLFNISCSEKSSRRLIKPRGDDDKDKDQRGVEGLNGTREVLYNKIMSLVKEARAQTDIFLPKDGESFTYKLNLEDFTQQRFKLKNVDTSCLFKYSEIELSESIVKVNDEYQLVRKLSPIEPEYIGFPSEDIKAKCIEEKEQLNITKKAITMEMTKLITSYRKMIRENFLSLIEICKKGDNLPKLGKCQGMQIFQFEERADGPREADSIYYFSGEIKINDKKHVIKNIFSLRNLHWGFGGVFSWVSPTTLDSKELKLQILGLQSIKGPR